MENSSNKTEQDPIKDVDAKMELLQKITELVSGYSDYNSPYLRSDGDIVITLNPKIKRKRQATQNLTDAIKLMMNGKKPVRNRK